MPEQYIYGPDGEMQRLTPQPRVGYAGSGRKTMNGDNNQEQERQMEEWLEEQRKLHRQQYLESVLKDLKDSGRVAADVSIETWQASLDPNEYLRLVGEFNKQWLTIRQNLLAQLAQGGGRPSRGGEQRGGRSIPASVRELLDEGQNFDLSYVRNQLEYSRQLQSFDTVGEMFFELSQARDKERWGAKVPDTDEYRRLYGDRFFPSGRYPLCEITGEEITVNGRKKPKIKLNEANILRFVRYYMNFYHGESPFSDVNFFEKLQFEVGGRRVSLYNEAFVRRDIMFVGHNENKEERDKETQRLQRLADDILKEIFAVQVVRNQGLNYYLHAGGGGKNYVELLRKLFEENRLTDPYWGQESSLMSYLSQLPQHFTGETWEEKVGDEKVLRRRSDNKIGFAFLGIVEAIMDLADWEELSSVFGPDCALLDFKKLTQAVREQAIGKGSDPEEVIKELRNNHIEDWDKAENGDRDAYIKLINLFITPQKEVRIADAVRSLIKQMIGEKYDLYVDKKDNNGNIIGKELDDDSLGIAMLLAENFAHVTGIATMLDVNARNFSGVDIYRSLRARLRDIRGRMRWSGPPTTWNVFNQTTVPFFWASSMNNGLSIAENFKALRKQADKTTDAVKKNQGDQDAIKKAQQAFQKKTYELRTGRNEQSQFVFDNITNATAIHEMMASGQAIKWEEYTQYDAVDKQFVLKEAEFGAQVQNEIIKRLYNMYNTWGKINFAQDYRMQQEIEVDTGKKDDHDNPIKEVRVYYVTVPLAVAMFGKEVIDIRPFWKLDEHHNPVLNMLGEHVIDVKEINSDAGKRELVKSVFLNIVAGQVFAHRMKYSHEHRYGSKFYRAVLTALKAIPDADFRDPTNLQNNRFVGSAFSHEKIRWLRKKAKITELDLALLDLKRHWRRPGAFGEAFKGIFGPIGGAMKSDFAA